MRYTLTVERGPGFPAQYWTVCVNGRSAQRFSNDMDANKALSDVSLGQPKRYMSDALRMVAHNIHDSKLPNINV